MVDGGLCCFDPLLYCHRVAALEYVLREKMLCVCTEGENAVSEWGAKENECFLPIQKKGVIYQHTTRGQCGAVFLHMLRALQLQNK